MELTPNLKKLIIFDFDGVLADTQTIVNKIEWEYCVQHGVNLTLEQFTQRFSGAKAVYILDTLQKEGKLATVKHATEMAHELDELVFKSFSEKKILPTPGIKRLLQKIPIKKCVASNCDFELLNKLLVASSLASYFGTNAFGADQVERPKPYPDLFLYAAHVMGEIPEKCLVIEDSEIGVKAGVEAKMEVLGFVGGSHTNASLREKLLRAGASHVFTNMAQLMKFLDTYCFKNDFHASAYHEPQQKNRLDGFEERRKNMVETQIKARGIKDTSVLKIMMKIPRHLFVPEGWQFLAYEDNPLPIGLNQTISQPYIVALMSEAAQITPQDRILEIGTGSGYQAAILSLLGKEVYTIERISLLAKNAEKRLHKLGYKNVHVKQGDGNKGWLEHAPYDVIIVTAAASDIPQELLDQLVVGGRMVVPVETLMGQQLVRLQKINHGDFSRESLGSVSFVPFIREED